MLPKKDLEAVHSQDLKALLEKWGYLPDFQNGKLKCNMCGDVLSEKNFGAIFSKNNKILFSCSKLECLAKIQK